MYCTFDFLQYSLRLTRTLQIKYSFSQQKQIKQETYYIYMVYKTSSPQKKTRLKENQHVMNEILFIAKKAKLQTL